MILAMAAFGQNSSEKVLLSGTVVNSVTGLPVRNAQVWLSSGGETQTDTAGVFRFQNLDPGDCHIWAAKTGFTSSEAQSVSLRTSTDNFVIQLSPLASIRGRVTDEDSEPVQGVTVQVLQVATASERLRNEVVSTATTDDRGEFRIPLLTPGKYLVLASGQASQDVYYGSDTPRATRDTFAPVYFGGSPDANSATVVELQAGIDARADINVAMQPGHNISGRITNLVPGRVVDLQLCSSDSDRGENRNSIELATGRFEITGVLDGRYKLRAWQRSNDNEVLYGDQEIVVSGRDMDRIAVTLGGVPALKGKVRVEGPEDRSARFVTVKLQAQTVFPSAFQYLSELFGQSAGGETIDIPEVVPGRYWIAINVVGGGAYVSAAHAGQTDLLASGELVFEDGAAPELDIVVRTDSGQVSGTVGTPDTDAAVLLVPEACNRLPSSAIAQAGAFTVLGLAPGTYRIYAWKRPPELDYTSRQAICELAQGGMAVEVKAGEVTKVQIPKLSEEPK